jgi:hypothetical protein
VLQENSVDNQLLEPESLPGKQIESLTGLGSSRLTFTFSDGTFAEFALFSTGNDEFGIELEEI